MSRWLQPLQAARQQLVGNTPCESAMEMSPEMEWCGEWAYGYVWKWGIPPMK